VVSDERLVMALLAEGNPATELGDDAWTELNAATYLATLERRSSEMTQVDTKKSPRRTQPRSTTPWLIAAIIVGVLGVAAVVVSQAGEPAIPLAGADDDPQAVEAFKAVEAAYGLFNTGDPAWMEVRLRGSFFETEDEADAALSELTAKWSDEQAWDLQMVVSGCTSQGHGQWPDLVDKGVPAPSGYYFICETTKTDSVYEVAGVSVPGTYHWVVENGAVVAVTSEGSTSQADAFGIALTAWLREAHPEVAADITPLFEDPADVPATVEYAKEFVAQSPDYPIETGGS
jgi:hypothetical protein